jgi:hypothetical protein
MDDLEEAKELIGELPPEIISFSSGEPELNLD